MKKPVQSILLISALSSLLITAGCAKSFHADLQSLPPTSAQPIDAEKAATDGLPNEDDDSSANGEQSTATKTEPVSEEQRLKEQKTKQDKARQSAEQQLNPYKLSDEELNQFKDQVFQQEVNTQPVIPTKTDSRPKVHTRGQSLYKKPEASVPEKSTKPVLPAQTTPAVKTAPKPTASKADDQTANQTASGEKPEQPVANSSLQDLLNTGVELKPNDKIIETLEMCKNLSAENNVEAKDKKQFICKLLPPALRMQQLVFKQRLSILNLMKKQGLKAELSKNELIWLDQIRKSYRLTETASWQDILERVDITPLPMLFAQSVVESGWGKSLLAVRGKNYFGVKGFASNSKCWDKPDSINMCHKAYSSIDESVSDYIHFLNTTKSSTKFRKTRRQMRANGVPLNSFTLIATLDQYSERRAWYINMISEMMKDQKFVSMVLSEELPE